MHNLKSAMSLHTAALLKQLEVNFSKCLLSELRLKKFKSKKKWELLLLMKLLLKALCNWIITFHLQYHDKHPVPLGKWSDLPGFFYYQCPNKLFLNYKYAMKWFYKEFALQGSLVAILWINEVCGTRKLHISIALKSGRYIFDFWFLSSRIFLILNCLIKR